MFENLKKKLGPNETDAEKRSREARQKAEKEARDKREEGQRAAEEKRQETKGYKSDYEKKLGKFGDMFLKKKK